MPKKEIKQKKITGTDLQDMEALSPGGDLQAYINSVHLKKHVLLNVRDLLRFFYRIGRVEILGLLKWEYRSDYFVLVAVGL